MEKSKKTIGQRIKELREIAGLTQLELGEKLFVSDKTVSKWEKDKSEPESGILVKIAELFNVTLDYLLTGQDPETDNNNISKIELACREDNIALLNGVDFEAFDDKGKNIDYYVNKYKAINIRRFLFDYQIDKMIKDDQKKQSYVISGIPKNIIGEDNRILLAWGGAYSKAAEKCAELEKEGFHHFKVLREVGVNEKIDKDYQYFFGKFLNELGQDKIVFSTAVLDDMESGVLTMTIFRDKSFKENKHHDGKLVPDYHPLSDTLYESHCYIRPQVLDDFITLLSDINVKDWENKHWGCPIYALFYVLKDAPKDDLLACHKFYVAPERELYSRFVKGIERLFFESLPTKAYKAFINAFDPKYHPYYRQEMNSCESTYIFKNIEEEIEEIKNKRFLY